MATTKESEYVLSFVVPEEVVCGNLFVERGLVGGGAETSNALPVTNVFTWTDPSIRVGQTTVKSAHIRELRFGINAKFVAAGLPEARWTNTCDPQAKLTWVRDIYELRYAVNRRILVPYVWTDPNLNLVMPKAVHIKELRMAINELNFAAPPEPLLPDVRLQLEGELGFAVVSAENKLAFDPKYSEWLLATSRN
jgi:hypothetical protein